MLRRPGSGAAAGAEGGGRSAPAELPPLLLVHGAPGSTRIFSAEFRAWVVLWSAHNSALYLFFIFYFFIFFGQHLS